MYIRLENENVVEYPANPHIDNLNVSFPNEWSGGTIQGKTYAKVISTEQPQQSINLDVIELTPVFDGDDWIQVWDVKLRPVDEIKNLLSLKRYEIEIGGVRVGGHIYHTDRESQTKYIAIAIDLMQANTETWSIHWKTKEGQFVVLNATEMNAVITAVKNHVQACFDKEAEYYNLIDTADDATLETTDFSVGWPSNQ